MHIITGASGQVGSAVVANLIKKGEQVKGMIHSDKKGEQLKQQGAEVAVADAFDVHALTEAFKSGDTLFAITPETGKNEDVIADTKKILGNYRKAVEAASIKKVVGLSSIGAQISSGSGNLLMSYLLEHAFEGLDIQTTFIRPSYYFSNWMMYLPVVKEKGVLPTFYPADLQLPMISPLDVAGYAADIITRQDKNGKIYELLGPAYCSPADVATAFGNALHKDVKAQQIPRHQWEASLEEAGFSPDGIKNFVEMTELVVAGKTAPQAKGTTLLKAHTTLQKYIDEAVHAKATA